MQLIDETDPGKKSQYNREKERLKQEVAKYQKELESLEQTIEKLQKQWSDIQSLEKLYSSDLINNNQQDVQVIDNQASLLSRILNPFIREVETRLRSNLNFWNDLSQQTESWKWPPIDEIDEAVGIASTLTEITDNIDDSMRHRHPDFGKYAKKLGRKLKFIGGN